MMDSFISHNTIIPTPINNTMQRHVLQVQEYPSRSTYKRFELKMQNQHKQKQV